MQSDIVLTISIYKIEKTILVSDERIMMKERCISFLSRNKCHIMFGGLTYQWK